MATFFLLVIIGAISGFILGLVMKIVRIVTGNEGEILLYNMDYIPVLKRWADKSITGLIFHYMTCIVSAVVLFYMLVPLGFERDIWPYVLVYSAGGGVLFFLSILTPTPPSHKDTAAWINWTVSHAIFGVSVGLLIYLWI